MNDDLLAESVECAVEAGWRLVPQIGQGTCDNALIWIGDGWTDVVTIPIRGRSTVVRLYGGPIRPDHPRRPGLEKWRHRVPVEVAVNWVLSGPNDDRELRDWSDR